MPEIDWSACVKSLSLVIVLPLAFFLVACDDGRLPTPTSPSEVITEPAAGRTSEAGASPVVELTSPSTAGAVQAATPGAIEPGPLVGRSWLLVSINEEPPLPGSSITAVFGPSNTLGGWTGCNSYAASIQVENDGMIISRPVVTPYTCRKTIMDQETWYLDALSKVTNYTIRDDELVMYDDEGETLVSYRPITPTTLPGTTWRVTSINSGEQGLAGLLEGMEMTLAFGEDGLLAGMAGCNTFTAIYRLDGQDLSVELNGGETTPAGVICLEPPGIMAQEQQFLAALEKIVTYQIAGDTLILRAADEAVLAQLSENEVIPAAVEVTPPDLIGVVANATYRLAHVAADPVTLIDGRYPGAEDDQSADETIVTLTDFVASGLLRSGENVAVVVLATDRGFGVLRYDLAVLNLEGEQPENVATVFLDDRIELEKLAIENGQIVVDIITQGPDDPLCCPTQPAKLTYMLRGNDLIQTSRQALGAVEQEIITDPSAGFISLPEEVFLGLQGLASSYRWQLVIATPYDDCCAPTPTGMPAHLVVTFNGQDPASAAGEDGPILYVLPISAYQRQWASSGDDTIIEQAETLRELLHRRPAVLDKPLPLLPPNGLTNTLVTASGFVDLESGSGIRFVGVFGEIQGPLVNSDLRYYFQGLTRDGQYYISLIYPVSAWFLPDARNEVPPAEQAEFDDDPEAYIAATLERLNTLVLSEWSPGLDKLDALIKSLRINP